MATLTEDPHDKFLEILTAVFRSDLDAMGLLYQEEDGKFVLPAGYTGVRGATQVFPYLFQGQAVSKGSYGKPFIKLNRVMFPISFDGAEGMVQITPGMSQGLFQTLLATVTSTDILRQDVIYSRPHETDAFIVTYKAKLPVFNRRLAVKVASGSVPKTKLLVHLDRDNSAKGQNLSALRATLASLPNAIRVDLYFQKDNPRVAYLVFPNLKGKNQDVDRAWREDEHDESALFGEGAKKSTTERAPSGKALLTMKGLKVHPISLMTVNSWLLINDVFDHLCESAHIPFEASHVNSIKGDRGTVLDGKITIEKESNATNNAAKFGADYLKFIGSMDLDWLKKHRKTFFSDDAAYDLFVKRETSPVPKPPPSYDEFYREAVRRARNDAQEDEKFALDSDAYHDAVNAYFEKFKRTGNTDV